MTTKAQDFPEGAKNTSVHLRCIFVLSRVLNGRAAISPVMALRLEGWLGLENGGHADAWLAQQTAYDLWQAREAGMPKVTPAAHLQKAA